MILSKITKLKIAVLKVFLPAAMSEDELHELVRLRHR